MTTRKINAAKPTPIQVSTEEAVNLFGIDTGAGGFDYSGLDLAAVGSLIEWVGRAGGLVSLGSSSGGTRIYISLRLDKQSKGYDFETAHLFNDFIKRVVGAWKLKARDVEAKRAQGLP